MDKRKISRGLRSPETLGNKPIIGITMFVVGCVIFMIIAYNLVNKGPLIRWDLPVAIWFHTLALNSSSIVINIMIAGYYVWNWGMISVGIILGLYFIYKRFWRELVMIIVSLGGSGLLFLILSNIFNRPRPSILFNQLVWAGNLTIPGFPSGHAKSILVFCGFLIYLILPNIKSYLGKILTVSAASLVVIYVGFSRLFVSDHYLTDVIAGYAVGVAWLGLSLTFIDWIFLRCQRKKGVLVHTSYRYIV